METENIEIKHTVVQSAKTGNHWQKKSNQIHFLLL